MKLTAPRVRKCQGLTMTTSIQDSGQTIAIEITGHHFFLYGCRISNKFPFSDPATKLNMPGMVTTIKDLKIISRAVRMMINEIIRVRGEWLRQDSYEKMRDFSRRIDESVNRKRKKKKK